MTKKADGIGFWQSIFPNQLGNFCFLLFLAGLALVVLHAVFNLNVFDPDDFKSTDARIPDLGTRRVVDEAGVLTVKEIDSLTREIDAYEAASGGQLAVLLIRSLHGDALEDFSLAVAEKWKIGQKGKDNGLLLLLVIDDHRSRLETGYGMEGIINDARAGDILRAMAPYLRNEQYPQAISFAIRSAAAFVLNEAGPEAPEDSEDGGPGGVSVPDGPEGTLFKIIALCVLLDIVGTLVACGMIHPDVRKSFGLVAMIVIGKILLEAAIAALRSGGGGRSRSGGRGGGSSRSGGGGGGFGGGGASGRW